LLAWLLIPVVLQAVATVVDEVVFHRARGLPRWERIGHPLDTLVLALALGWLVVTDRATAGALPIYVALAAFSTLFVTKDEPLHARVCTAGEHWLHSVLFVLHPIVLGALGVLWWIGGHHTILVAQLGVVLAFAGYQGVYWNVVRGRAPRAVDNRWYASLGPKWRDAEDTPIALLRAEARHRNPWIADQIVAAFGAARPVRVLDLGCGAGFLSNDLAARGHDVTGLDVEHANIEVARAGDTTRAVRYVIGDACKLPFADSTFDVVSAMDLLEHVETPERVIAEAARVLAPSGLLFFHTFNRTWLANLVVIKGVRWFVRNAPPDLHVLRLFITPDELTEMCRSHALAIGALRGSRPRFRWPLWRMLVTGRVGADFSFTFTRSTQLGYTGFARAARGSAPTGAASSGHASCVALRSCSD